MEPTRIPMLVVIGPPAMFVVIASHRAKTNHELAE
jgi:hypothetical protein